jgi:putative methionine-R-sulfoxide reductase with GAF domain
MKSFRSVQATFADIERLLSQKYAPFRCNPLEEVAGILTEARHYSWVGIYLGVGKNSSSALLEAGHHPAQVAVPNTVRKILVAMKIAGRELGYLSVESDRENAFGAEERVLLERVAGLLARFLVGNGKYLMLKATKPEPPLKAAAARR